ncbi:hypothetical protein [Paenisporosarcina quisquiliarum]|uniref:hypothetical protein n=1 Tax=Paenisporosarcina quisquiliarum TaxID=365346 RepID=UPI003736255A
MAGNRKTHLELINSHFKKPKNVQFIQVENAEISTLYTLSKEFSNEIKRHYEFEDQLKETFTEFKKIINRFFTSLDIYSNIFDEYLNEIFNLLQNIQSRYPDLFKQYCIPIAKILKTIQTEYGESNFLKNSISEKLQNIVTKKTYILTKFLSNTPFIVLNDIEVPIIKANEFIKLGIVADNVIYIGSPFNYDKKYSSLFFSKNTYFLTYNIFNNQIQKTRNFPQLSVSDTITTIYDNIQFSDGHKGAIFEVELGDIADDFNEEEIIKHYENNATSIKEADRVECKLILLENRCYSFIPNSYKIRRLEPNSLKLDSVEIKQIELGNLLLFRNHSSVDLIIDIADTILDVKATRCRTNQRIWRKRLTKQINRHGIKELAQLLNSQGISTASEQNIRNWIEPERIAPNCLPELLKFLEFTEKEIRSIIYSTELIRSAHLKAGRFITTQLLESIKLELINDIEEQGFATFSADTLVGASFNIEVVKQINEKTIVVDRKDILKIWRA